MAGIAIRDDLVAAERRAWAHVAGPGTWLSGQRRIAVAAEARNAPGCGLCRKRKAALSPYAVDGEHDALGELPDEWVEVVHRIRTDPGRITRRWYGEVLESGIGDAEYVEILGLVSIVVALDSFRRAIGRPSEPLPAPLVGEPSRHRPAGARITMAWVPTLEPEDVADGDPDPYEAHDPPSNIHKALSLVPETQRAFFGLSAVFYLPGAAMTDYANQYRAITHSQIELIAARVSALNQCFY